MNSNIWFIFDIDGVVTDGTVYVSKNGEEQKRLNMKDIDAIYELAERGYSLAAVTADKNEFTEWVSRRFPWKEFLSGVKDKNKALQQLRKANQILKGNLVYIGDGKKDLDAFKEADYRICPQDAIEEIRKLADVILKQPSGTGALWELIKVADTLFNETEQPHAFSVWNRTLDEHLILAKTLMLDTRFRESVVAVAEMILMGLRANKRILLFGNGGSAADAQHIAAEFMGRSQKEREPWDVEALTVNTSLLTAVTNDYGYNEVFSRQIRAIVKTGDVVIGISTSGRSENVLIALSTAKKLGGLTVLMTGQDGFSSSADVVVNVPSSVAARIQEIHIIIGHFLAQYAETELCNGV